MDKNMNYRKIILIVVIVASVLFGYYSLPADSDSNAHPEIIIDEEIKVEYVCPENRDYLGIFPIF